MYRYPADHPIWQIITHGMYGVLIIGCLYLNASSFDSTEVTTIGQIFAAIGGAEWLKSKVKKKVVIDSPLPDILPESYAEIKVKKK